MSEFSIDNFQSRISELTDATKLRTVRLLVIGLGAFGAWMVEQLVRLGVASEAPGNILVIDPDVVALENLSRQPYLHEQVGIPKVDALAQYSQMINPTVRMSTWKRKITTRDIPELVDRAQESQLVVYAADSVSTVLGVSDHIHDVCPQLMGFFGPRCDFAELAFSVPGVTPTLRSTLGDRRRQRIHAAQALPMDTRFVANFAAAVAMQILLGDTPSDVLPPLYADAPQYAIGLRHTWIFQNMPPDQLRSIFLVGSAPNVDIPLIRR